MVTSYFNKIIFLSARLRNASFQELGYRVRQAGVTLKLFSGLWREGKRSNIPLADAAYLDKIILPEINFDHCSNTIPVFPTDSSHFRKPDIDESRKYEKHFSRIFYPFIQWKDSIFDIRSAWETSRLQQATHLLFCTAKEEGAEAGRIAREQASKMLISWIYENPFPYGIHYISVMECALRIPVFLYVLKLADSLSGDEKHIIQKAIYHHTWLIDKRLSLFSSLGNHTVCECVGLVFGGLIYRNFPFGERWLQRGIQILRRELFHQVLEDGGPAEQSIHYHRFVLDLYWLAVDFMEKNGIEGTVDMKDRLIQGETFLSFFELEQGKYLSIGDSDDGYAVAPRLCPKREQIEKKEQENIYFQKSGYSVLRSQDNILFTFNHGPLGMAPLYNHGHADALSITLSRKGIPVLTDPGTYRYNGVPEYRKYFKGTRAHNTITVDNMDQAIQETGFIWKKPYEIRNFYVKQKENFILLSAEHTGYERLPNPVCHKREILCFDTSDFFILDSFIGVGIHHFELNFHLFPDIDVEKDGEWWKMGASENPVAVRLLSEDGLRFVEMDNHSFFGWYSPRYGEKEKCSVLQASITGEPENVSFLTAICTNGIVSDASLGVYMNKFGENK